LFFSFTGKPYIEPFSLRIIFIRDPDGKITGFTADYEGVAYTTNKIK